MPVITSSTLNRREVVVISSMRLIEIVGKVRLGLRGAAWPIAVSIVSAGRGVLGRSAAQVRSSDEK
jgi:hypothetical protein